MSLGDSHSLVSAKEADTPEQVGAIFLDGIEAGEQIVYSKERTREDLQRRAEDDEGWLDALARQFPDPAAS